MTASGVAKSGAIRRQENRGRRRARRLLIAATLAAATAAGALVGQAAGDLPAIDVATASVDSLFTTETGDQAYSQPIAGLDAAQAALFAKGRDGMHKLWVVAPSMLGLWGRGPTSNAEICTDCHDNNGRGALPERSDEPLSAMLVRLSVKGADEHGAPLPHPAYGGQLQQQGILGYVPPEGEALVSWKRTVTILDDGTKVELRSPEIRFRKLAFGPIGPDTLQSVRLAPALVGLGLLQAVPEATIASLAGSAHGDGIRGRVNRVWDIEAQRLIPGRFGLKANQPSLRQQIAAAFHEDLGVNSALFPDENCPEVQVACRKFPPGGRPELTPDRLVALSFYMQARAVPQRRDRDDPIARRGEQLFSSLNCDACHVPTLLTGDDAMPPQLARQTIHPYTDLLLHDMGEGLADGRPDFAAGPRDWRTPALWGMGLARTVNGNAFLLHDGRARNAEEAVLWHGGEAGPARKRYAALDAGDRAALLRFLDSL